MTVSVSEDQTEVGSYFISNYPPFSFWNKESISAVDQVLRRTPGGGPDTHRDDPHRGQTPGREQPLGLYLHIPFCRKRCKFCYFRVYTDKNGREVERYMAALAREVELYSQTPTFASRPLRFAYFGGGTPSFLSEKQLGSLARRLREHVSWDGAEEVTFECEPGTLTEQKLAAIRDVGVTRLSLGVENYDDGILEENGRAHRSPEVFKAYDWARGLGFSQINIDLIAGMVGETEENWHSCVEKTIELDPECITIYQMELPYNAVYADSLRDGRLRVADWKTKRRWVNDAFDALAAAGYRQSSAYTMVKSESTRFVYRDALWHGADMVGTGVASFSHVGGVHYQNVDGFQDYVKLLEEGRLPFGRALRVSEHQLMIRELILQLKLGYVFPSYFQDKFAADIRSEFREIWESLCAAGLAEAPPDDPAKPIRLTRAGLLRVDSLLPQFFEPEHRGARYT